MIDRLRAGNRTPSRPVGVVNFTDEEGARFGVACGGSRLLAGSLDPDRARGLRDADGVTLAEAVTRAGRVRRAWRRSAGAAPDRRVHRTPR